MALKDVLIETPDLKRVLQTWNKRLRQISSKFRNPIKFVTQSEGRESESPVYILRGIFAFRWCVVHSTLMRVRVTIFTGEKQ
jgi:hypothetical protein